MDWIAGTGFLKVANTLSQGENSSICHKNQTQTLNKLTMCWDKIDIYSCNTQKDTIDISYLRNQQTFAYWESETTLFFFYVVVHPKMNVLSSFTRLSWLSLFWGTNILENTGIQCIIISALKSIHPLVRVWGVRWRCRKVNKSFPFSILAFTGLMNETRQTFLLFFEILHIHGYSEISLLGKSHETFVDKSISKSLKDSVLIRFNCMQKSSNLRISSFGRNGRKSKYGSLFLP